MLKKVLEIEAKVLAKGVGIYFSESALCAPSTSFAGVEFYEGFPHKAAILLKHLIKNYPVPDENKRPAMRVSENLYLLITTVGKPPKVMMWF